MVTDVSFDCENTEKNFHLNISLVNPRNNFSTYSNKDSLRLLY